MARRVYLPARPPRAVPKLLAALGAHDAPRCPQGDIASGITPGLPLLSSGRVARVLRDDSKVINFPTDILVNVPKVVEDAR
jgi:hypothetical protein